MDLQAALQHRAQVEEFRRKHKTALLTLVFTDIVGSTRLKQELGDVEAVSLIQRHHELVRRILGYFKDAEEINTAGDSFFIVFLKPSDAVRFALLVEAGLRAFSGAAGRAITDRIGLHIGEVVVVEETATAAKPKDLYGMQVDSCSRVMSLAKGDQILMTHSVFDNARQVLKGQDAQELGPLSWMNHGPYLLAGMDEPAEICEVGETGKAALNPPADTDKAHRQVSPDSEPVLGWRPALEQVIPGTKWVLERKLGEGGFGEVWLGRHETLKERRILKFCFRADRVRSLKREVTIFRLLKEKIGQHPNIVGVQEVFFDQPPYYIMMDYAEGKDLKSWCEDRGGAERIPLDTRLEIVAQVADALQAAHDAGVIHRDVKPTNIIVCKAEASPAKLNVKLTDFGIGQVVSQEVLAGITRGGFTQTIAGESSSQTGTHLYMAPELLAGKPATTRSDTYSLGIVLYQLLVGDLSRPLTMDWAKEIADPLLREDLEKCFAGNPQDRFAAPGQLAQQLRSLPKRHAAWTEQQAAVAAREKAAYRKGVLWTAGIAAIIIATTTALFIYARTQARQAELARAEEAQLRRQAEAQELVARKKAYASDMNVAKQALDQNNLGRAQDLLDRQRPQPGQRDLRGWEWRYLWQQCRSDALFTLCQESSEIESLAVSQDGQWLAIGQSRGGMSVWDVRTRQELIRLAKGEKYVRAAFSPTEPLLAFTSSTVSSSGPARNTLRLWNATTRQMIAEFPLDHYCMGLAFSKDGRTLVTSTAFGSGSEGRITLWRMPEGTKLASYPSEQGLNFEVGTCFAATPGLSLAAYSFGNGRIRLIDLRDGKEIWTAAASKEIVIALAFSPDGKILAAAAGFTESDIRLWDVATGKEIGRLEGHGSYVSSLVFWPDGKKLASSSADQTSRIWDVASRKCLDVLRGHRQEVWRVAILPDDKTLVSGCKDGTVCFWDTSVTHLRQPHITIPENVVTWQFTPDSRSVLTLNQNQPGPVSRWSASDFQQKEALPEFGTNWYGLAFSQDGRFLASGSTNGVLQIWDVSRQVQRLLTNTLGAVFPVSFLADGKKLITVSVSDHLLHKWNLATGLEIQSWPVPSRASAIYFSPDGRSYVTTYYDGGIVLGNFSGESSTNVNLDFLEGVDASFSPDGNLFAVASSLGYARVWDTATWREAATLGGFLNGVHSVAFSPDGKRLTLGSNGKEAIKLYDVESRQEVLTLAGRGSEFSASTFSGDGNILGSVNGEGVLHLWRAPSWMEIEAAEQVQAKVQLP